jgi:uncharacterized protein YecE (DUF72 family)
MGQNPERPGRALNEKRARLPEQAVSHCTGGGAGGPCGVNPPDTAKIHIGTCAWTHDDWRGVFYPEHLPSSERLAFYARWFDAVEVDSTFYHIPASHVTAHWAEVTPPGFRFSCKVPREITHERKLRDVDEPLAAFLHGVKPLREKLACLLVQTPRWFSPRHDEHALRDFIRALPDGFPWAVEFRDEAWHLPRIVHLLEHHNVAWAWNDLSPLAEADAAAFGFFPQTADFAVVRLMGDPETKYFPDGSRRHHYGKRAWLRAQSLENWAVKIRQTAEAVGNVFVSVNNHFEGCAPFTIRELAQRLGREVKLPDNAEVHPQEGRGQLGLWE